MTTTTPSNEKAAPVVLPVDLRDYFAAQAIAGFLRQSDDGFTSADDVAAEAYKLADAMIRARAT